MNEDAFTGCLIGTAVGDALGLPAEGLSRRRQRRLFGEIDRHRLLFGRGMVSDDTEHTLMMARALLESGGEAGEFRRRFARHLRLWILGLPAGVGKATLIAGLKLWAGIPPPRSGVRSAGNGPAMRSAILGPYCGPDLHRMQEWVRASTEVTHSDPKAYWGALAVALAAWMNAESLLHTHSPLDYQRHLGALLHRDGAEEFLALVTETVASVLRRESTEAFAERMGWGNGVSGYVYRTVPVALHAALSHPRDYRAAVSAVIRCGGDTDTTAAITGGIVGAGVGEEGIPREWLDGLWDWPRTLEDYKTLGRSLAEAVNGNGAAAPPPAGSPLFLLRNLIFLAVVLFHGFRRLLPPY